MTRTVRVTYSIIFRTLEQPPQIACVSPIKPGKGQDADLARHVPDRVLVASVPVADDRLVFQEYAGGICASEGAGRFVVATPIKWLVVTLCGLGIPLRIRMIDADFIGCFHLSYIVQGFKGAYKC